MAFKNAFEKLVKTIPELPEAEKNKLILEIEIGELKTDPQAEKKLQHKEQQLRKKMSRLENDIAVWKNNLEFFARSKNADNLREEFNQKIAQATEKLNELRQQLKILRTMA
jgi:succinylglutamate desuccinylase